MRTRSFQTAAIRAAQPAILLAALVAVPVAQAHHSAVQYDFGQNVEATGKIIHLEVSNPHIDLVLEVTAADGSTKQIQFEGHSRNNVYRRGWRPDMLQDGDAVTIFIAPLRDGSDGGYIQSFKLTDGRQF
jgi:Family of unknown function (DUF6152)